MNEKNWLSGLFSAIDAKDVDSFIGHLEPDCRFIFGNLPAITGIQEIADFVATFFDSINALEHQLIEYWSIPGGMICHGVVSYTRHDGSVLSVPFSNIFKLSADRAQTYQIFADTSQLYRD